MKKLFLLVLALFSIAANAQPPVPRSGPAVTAVDYRLGAKLNFYLPHNHGRWMNGGLDSLGMIMYEDSSRHIWYIDTVTGGGHQWTMLLRAGDVPAFNQDSIKHAFVDTGARARNLYTLAWDSTNRKWILTPPVSGGGGSGTVTTVGFTAANGFTGNFSNPTTTPNLIIGTSVTGLLFGNGTAIGAVTVSSPLTYSGGVLGIQNGSGSQPGAISASDWTTFNNKQNALSGTGYIIQSGATSSFVSGAATNLVGYNASGTGSPIILGTNLSMTGNTLNAGGGGGSQTFPQVLATGRTLSGNDSLLLGGNYLYAKNGSLRADQLRLNYTDSNMTTGVIRLGTNGGDTGVVVLSFYSPIEPGYNIFLGVNSGSRHIPTSNTGDNGALNIGIGYNTFQSITTAHENTSVGNQNMQFCTTCLGNAMFGETAGKLFTTAIDNTAVGVHAMNLATTAFNNTAIGKRSMEALTTGSNNTALGWQSMDSATTATFNIGIGYRALAAGTNFGDNVAVGSNSLSLAKSSYNTAVGTHSLGYLTDGNKNVAVGEEAGSTTTDIHDIGMTYLGFSSRRDPSGAAGIYNTGGAIGYNAVVGQSHSFAIGAPSNTADSVNIGIGTSTPDRSALLELKSISQGLLITRLSNSQRDAMANTKATGLLIFNTDSVKFQYWDASAWQTIGGGSGGGGTVYTFSTGLNNSANTITNKLATGFAGGQSVIGGTASGETLTLSSTTNATKGKILMGTSAYDEVNNRLGLGTNAPTAALHVQGTSSLTAKITDNSFYTLRISSASSGTMRFAVTTGSMSFGTQATDGGTYTDALTINATNGTSIFTASNLGTAMRIGDVTGNATLRVSIPANLQAGLATVSSTSLVFGFQTTDGGTFTENMRISSTNGNLLIATTTDNNGSLQIAANTTTRAQLFLNGSAADVTSPTNGMMWYNSTTHALNFRDNGTTTNLLAGGGGTPGGANTQIQFNNSGAFGGSSSLTWSGTVLTSNALAISTLTNAGASDSVLTWDPATKAVRMRSGTFTLNVGNGVTAPTTDSIKLGGPLNQTTTIAQAGFGLTISGGQIVLGAAAGTRNWSPLTNTVGTSNFSLQTGTLNDILTAPSGTLGLVVANGISVPILSATNTSVTYTEAYSFYIAGAPGAGTNVTIGNSYALGVSGSAKLTGVVNALSFKNTTVTESAASSLTISTQWSVFNGTTATWTLPALSASLGLPLYIKNAGSGILTVQRAGSDNIYDTGSVTSLAVTPGAAIILIGGSAFWYKN